MRIGIAPCGHHGVFVIGQYVQCLEGCDQGRPPDPDVDGHERVNVTCISCHSQDVEVTTIALFGTFWSCAECGHRWLD